MIHKTYQVRGILGGEIFELPDWSELDLGFDMDDVAGLTGKYLRTGINADKVVEDLIVVVTVNGVEYSDSRWWIQGGQGDDSSKEGQYLTVMGKSLRDVFRRSIIRDPSKPYKARKFKDNTSPGKVLRTLFDDAQDRDAMTGFTWDFTNTKDSGSNDWAEDLDDLEYEPGSRILDAVNNLTEEGYCELRINKMVIQAYNTGGMGIDRSSSVVLNEGVDYMETPTMWTTEERAKYSLALGDKNSYVQKTDGAIPNGPFGREEQAIQHGGTKSTKVLTKANNASLALVSGKRKQVTRELKIRPEANIPLRDFHLGDMVYDKVGPAAEKLRVRNIIVHVHTDTATVVFNDKLAERAVKTAKKLSSISAAGGSSGGGLIDPAPPDDTVPDIPTNVQSSSSYYFTGVGTPDVQIRSSLVISWDPPEVNTDDTAIDDILEHEIRVKIVGGASWAFYKTPYPDADFEIRGLMPTTVYQIQVRCWDYYGHVSEWTDLHITAPLATDTTPPPKPSTPLLELQQNILTVRFSGLDADGEGMPVDTRYIAVQVDDEDGDGFREVSRLSGPGNFVLNLSYGTTYHIRFVAYDISGLESVPSEAATAVLRVPAAPTGFSLGTSIDFDSIGMVFARMYAQVTPVTTATDGQPLSISHYNLEGKPNIVGANWRFITSSNGPRIEYEPFKPGEEWTFRVQAMSAEADVPGLYSVELELTMGEDEDPPPKPDAPVLSSEYSVVTAVAEDLEEMPPDLRFIRVFADTSTPPTTVVGDIAARGSGSLLFSAEAGATIYVQFMAIDYSGNESEKSDVESIVVKSILDDTDLDDALSGLGGKDWFQDAEPDDPHDGDWWYPSNGNVFYRLGGAWIQKKWSENAISDGAISVAKLADGAVTRDKIVAGAIGPNEIADFAISVKKLNSNRHFLY